ncbi:hypothetical protein QE390_004895 [Siphonobacter sp. SORGH_AS 1065]|nr:hypothetical protein [Siphonobacter sp. SORGH_AS_1065]
MKSHLYKLIPSLLFLPFSGLGQTYNLEAVDP